MCWSRKRISSIQFRSIVVFRVRRKKILSLRAFFAFQVVTHCAYSSAQLPHLAERQVTSRRRIIHPFHHRSQHPTSSTINIYQQKIYTYTRVQLCGPMHRSVIPNSDDYQTIRYICTCRRCTARNHDDTVGGSLLRSQSYRWYN